MMGIIIVLVNLLLEIWPVLPLILWASLISYSRMYLGVHYPSDIIAGALVGSIIAAIVYYLAKQFNWIKC